MREETGSYVFSFGFVCPDWSACSLLPGQLAVAEPSAQQCQTATRWAHCHYPKIGKLKPIILEHFMFVPGSPGLQIGACMWENRIAQPKCVATRRTKARLASVTSHMVNVYMKLYSLQCRSPFFVSLVSCSPIVSHLATHTAETHADTAALQQAAPLLLSLGRRELQQDLSPLPASVSSLSAPTTIAPKSIDVATPATATTTVPLTTPAVLPDDNLAPSTSPSTAGLNNSSAVDPPVATVSHEQAWPSFLPSDSPAPEIAVEITEAPFPASIPPAAVVNNDALAPEDSTTDDGTTTSLTTPPPPPPDEPAEEPAEEPTEEPLSLPPVAAPDARPATLVDSVFSNQIHQGRLRISVVIIIAALMVLCGLSACTLFISVRTTILPLIFTGLADVFECLCPSF